MSELTRRVSARTAVAACLTAGASLALAGSGAAAAAAPGDNGTVKVHRSTTSADDPRNEPKVCAFYLVGFQFDGGQQVSWHIKSWPPTGDRGTVLSNTLTLDAEGHGRTADLTLPDGHYKLFWNFAGENGAAKHKVFWVDCGRPGPSPSPTPTHGGPGVPPGSPSPTTAPTTSPTTAPTSPTAGPGAPGGGAPTSGAPTTAPPSKNVSGEEGAGGGLPITGFAGRLLAALAAALILGGGAAIWLSRRARGRPTIT